MATLLVLQGPDKGRTFCTLNEPALLGRESDQIPLTDRTISRHHAELHPNNGTWILKDMGSANGTYVNGVRVRESVRLKHGDQIKIGTTLIVYSGDQAMEQMGNSRIPRDLIDLDVSSANMDSAILTSVSGEDSVIIAGPEVAQAARAWKVVSELASAIGVINDSIQLLERVMDVVIEELPVDRGFILMYDGPTQELVPQVVRYRRGSHSKKHKIATSKRIIQHVVDHREAVLCTNAMTDQRFSTDASQDSIHSLGLHSVICAPIIVRDNLLGVIHIDSAATTHTYNQEQLRLMSAVGQMTGLAVQNVRLVQQQMQTARLAATGETVAYLSHYIKNILQGMQSGGDLVDMGLKKQNWGMLGQGWQIVQRNLDRILQLTTNMLAYSKDRQPNLQRSNLNQIVTDALSLVQKQADKNSIVLMSDLEEPFPPIPVDPDGIHQVVLNIVRNALDAVPARTGVVNVSTRFHADQGIADITITDNGPGMPNERIPEIFEPFKSSKGHAGTGLGLPVARKIVREHHGRIVVESNPGEGSTFRIRLPVQELPRESAKTVSSLQ